MNESVRIVAGGLENGGAMIHGERDAALTKLSVIIPCYNGAKTIGAQLEALARQQWSGPWEVILADNGSVDETLAIVERYREKLPNLRIVKALATQTAAHAMNVGARVATGEMLLFCDADDEVGEGWLAAMAEALSKHDFVACRTDARKLNPSWLAEGLGSSQEKGLRGLAFAPQLHYAGGGTMGVKRSLLLETTRGFDESMQQIFDTLLCVQLQLAGTDLHFVPDAVLHVRHRQTLRALFRQGFGYGECHPLLYKKSVALGIPKLARPWRDGIGHWRGLLAELFRVRNKSMLARYAFGLGWHLGRLKGCIKHRVVFM
jgi:glycosyltransferase involved in cell wall biosynthesis